MPSDAPLAGAFLAYCAFGARREVGAPPTLRTARLDGASFAKLFRDAGLVAGGGCAAVPSSSVTSPLTPVSVDLAFKAAAAGSGGDGRRLGWAGFLVALETLAGKLNTPLPTLQATLASAGGPRATGPTTAAWVKWHDDTSTYTGVHGRGGGGGPTNVDGPRTLAALCDRRVGANVRGVPAGYGASR